MFSVGSKSLNSRGFWKMAKNKKKLRKAIRLPSHFVHHDLMPRKGQRLQQQQLKSSFIIHPRSSLHPFQFRKSQHKAFAIFSAFRFKLGGVKMFFLSAESKSSQQCGTRSFQKRQIDQLSNHGKPTQIMASFKASKRKGISKHQYH